MESKVLEGEVLERLNNMMMTADNERDYETLQSAIAMIRRYTEDKWRIQLPCAIGDVFYSIIGDAVNNYTVSGFRINQDVSYIETAEDMLCRIDRFGEYYFWSPDEAAVRFNQKWKKESKGA